jgi:hypothetical protein
MSAGSKDGAWRAGGIQAAGVDAFGNEHILNTDLTGTLEVDIVGVNVPPGQGIAVSQTGAPWQVEIVPDEADDFGYVAKSLTAAGTVVGIGDCRGIRVRAVGTDSTFTINGGDIIQIRSGDIFQIIPQGELVNPVITWLSGSIDVWMEVDGQVPGIGDLGLSLGIAHL